MDTDGLEVLVERIEKDLIEIKQDVKSLMMFMAVEKAMTNKRTKISAMIVGGIVSLVVTLLSKLLKI